MLVNFNKLTMFFLLFNFVTSIQFDFSPWLNTEDEVTELEITGYDYTSIDGRKLKWFKNLKKLKIWKTSIKELPKEIAELTNLTELIIMETNINKLPNTFGFLPKMQKLKLKNNRFCKFPTEVLSLKSLTYFDISHNKLSKLPNAFSIFLSALTVLKLSNNPLDTLPDKFFELPNLTTLKLSNTQLTEVSNKISKLKSLVFLDLSQNFLNHLPDEIGLLENLNSLNINENKIKTFPDSFNQLQKLQEFRCCGNSLTEFPTFLFSITELKKIEIDNNEIEVIPPEIKELKNLKELFIDQNKLTEIPFELLYLKELEHLSAEKNNIVKTPDLQLYLSETTTEKDLMLKNLIYVNLSNNQLRMFPRFILGSSKLTQLALEHNKIDKIPNDISALISLDDLALDHNDIVEIPESIQFLTNLVTFSINNNQIETLPYGLCRLNSLKYFILSSNKIERLPVNFCCLTALNEINISNCRLRELPTGWNRLTKLIACTFAGNYLTSIPSEFATLSKLRILLLYDNHISEIPREFIQLQHTLDILDLNDNPMCTSSRTGLGRDQLIKRFEHNVRIFNPNYSPRFKPIQEEEVYAKMQRQKYYWNHEELQKLVSFGIPAHTKTTEEIKQLWENLKKYITDDKTKKTIEEYINDIYERFPDLKKLILNSANDVEIIKNLLEAIIVFMNKLVNENQVDITDKNNLIESNFAIIAQNVESCSSGKIEELNAVYKILFNDYTERVTSLESFFKSFIIRKKQNAFDNLIGRVGGEQNVHLKQFWEFRARHKLGFSTEYRSEFGSLEQDPWRAHIGNFLNDFYTEFNLEDIVKSLTIAINETNEMKNLLLYYIYELEGYSDKEKLKMVVCPTLDELENAEAVKSKAVLIYLINQRLVLVGHSHSSILRRCVFPELEI